MSRYSNMTKAQLIERLEQVDSLLKDQEAHAISKIARTCEQLWTTETYKYDATARRRRIQRVLIAAGMRYGVHLT